MPPSGFNINRRGIQQFTREIQREFDKHPIKLPVETDDTGMDPYLGANMTNYYGPVVVVNGDHAQLAWENRSVTQNQSRVEEIAEGYEGLAQALVNTLQGLDAARLGESDRREVTETAKEVLVEVTKSEPDRSLVTRGVKVVKGALSSIALGMGEGVGDDAQAWARTAIDQLTTSF